MSFLNLIEEAELHREVYAAVLNSILKDVGRKRDLAEHAGITPQYLSNILMLDAGVTELRGSKRIPSSKVADRIVRALPLPEEERQSLREHMVLASERRLQAYESIRRELLERPIESVLDELREAYQQATFSRDPAVSRAKLLTVLRVSDALIKRVRLDRPSFVELCLLAQDGACVIDRPIDALWYAKQARSTMDGLDLSDYRGQEQALLDFRINSIRAEAVSYSILGLPKQAYSCCDKAEALLATKDFKDRYEFWKPHLYRDKMSALAGKPRFAIAEAEGLAIQVDNVCEKDIYTTEENELLAFLIHSSLARAHIQYESKRSWKRAECLLRTELEHMEKMTRIGALHRTQLLRAYARLRRKQGDQEGWQYFIKAAIKTASSTGLEHQMHEISQEYGRLVAPLLWEFGTLPPRLAPSIEAVH